MKKALNIVKNVLVWLIVAFAVCMMIFTIVSVTTVNRSDRHLLGYRAYIVLSDSMSKTDFDAGDMVVVKRVDPTTLKEGDIISFQSQNEHNYGETVTHKIRALTVDGNGDPGFITYGTTTDTNDEVVVTYPYILGKYRFSIPKLGTFFQFLKTTPGYIVCIFAPFMVLILIQGINCIKLFRRYKQEQLAELEAEKSEIEEQRRQSEAMLKELEALKAQLAEKTSETAEPVAAPVSETVSDNTASAE